MVGTLDSPVRLWPYSRITNVHWNDATHVAVQVALPDRSPTSDVIYYPQVECFPPVGGAGGSFGETSTLSTITYRYSVQAGFVRHKDGSWSGWPGVEGGLRGLTGHQTLSFDQWTVPPVLATAGGDMDTIRWSVAGGSPLDIAVPDGSGALFIAGAAASLEFVGLTIVTGVVCADAAEPPYFLTVGSDLPGISHASTAIEHLSAKRGEKTYSVVGMKAIDRTVNASIVGATNCPKTLWILMQKDG